MAGLAGHEKVIDDLTAYLQANMAARCAALAAVLPALVLPAPANADYHFGEKQSFPNYPAIALIPAPSPITNDRKDRYDIELAVAIGIFVTDGDESTLTRKLLRYARAVLEVLVDGRIANAFDFTIDLEGEVLDPSPARVADDASFERDLFIAVRCWKEEVR